MYNIFNLRNTEVIICYNINFIKERRWPQPSVKYEIVYTAIVRHNSETIYIQPCTKIVLPMPS